MSATGTGKTLDLAAQTALAWRADAHGEHMVIVSSLDTNAREDLVAARVMSGVDPDGGRTRRAAGAVRGAHVTPSPHALGGLMSVVGEGEDQIRALTVICTYDSLNKIDETQNTGYAVPPFDLAVMDEAHRIAGRADKKWAIVNDAKRIRAERSPPT
ncbi:DEAD/DEAH box helicase family protein [Streptomyces sp. NPDC005727]|uniref:DEAD/DEAH box helicase family protein n=1 Tax=Streptomyces sp. NPDC005727 TaxID=3157053 RepID=UPI0033DAA2D2